MRFRFAYIFLLFILLGLLVLYMSGTKWIGKYIDTSPKILIAKNSQSYMAITLPVRPSVTQQFAGSELVKYLQQISGADFFITTHQNKTNHVILIERSNQLDKDSYTITVLNKDIVLSGGSDRAILYATYDFLHRLGCEWLAPQFSFYNGQAEYIPSKSTLFYNVHVVSEQPRFAYRKLDVEEGRSHNVENLKQLIEWMPKLRYNILMVPLDYGGSGRVQWDQWREQLTPELEKRDLMIEVGGHGYQNFLNAKMPAILNTNKGLTLFDQHPEWFGQDKNCEPSPAEHMVFNTSNQDAMQYFTNNIAAYISQHPEIDIFDFWPPDGARWAECVDFSVLGSSQDRQARLANQVDSVLKTIRPGLHLEIIAYARALLPPEKEALNKDILVDFCPINQSFEKQIYDPAASNNVDYVSAIRSWRKKFTGDIALYSYYRKYAWRSLPNIIPHYMQKDLQWYIKVPLQGICTYAEPGDWFTYELNHYVLGHLAWDPDCEMDTLIDQFCRIRFGSEWKMTKAVYTSLENIVRFVGSIPFTTLKSIEQIGSGERELKRREDDIRIAQENTSDSTVAANLSRLLLMVQYAYYDLQIQQACASLLSAHEIRKKVENMVSFLESNRDKGVFILSNKDNLAGFMKHYGLLFK